MLLKPFHQFVGHRSASGFTLIELMVTLSIAAVLAAIAVPSFRDFLAGQRVKTAAYDISYTLANVRSEALKRNANVVMAPASGGWQNGWTVTATGGAVVSGHEAFSGLTVTGPTSVTYNISGRVTSADNSFAVSSSVSTNATPRCVRIDLSGLSTSKAGAC